MILYERNKPNTFWRITSEQINDQKWALSKNSQLTLHEIDLNISKLNEGTFNCNPYFWMHWHVCDKLTRRLLSLFSFVDGHLHYRRLWRSLCPRGHQDLHVFRSQNLMTMKQNFLPARRKKDRNRVSSRDSNIRHVKSAQSRQRAGSYIYNLLQVIPLWPAAKGQVHLKSSFWGNIVPLSFKYKTQTFVSVTAKSACVQGGWHLCSVKQNG